ncbi:MAG: 3-phosphoshikimate 1-carboxyvinyltransferase [Microbacteriaceae bacterium]
MHLSVVGSGDRLQGEVLVPNSKYHAHRALVLASLAPGLSRISGLTDATHVQYTVALLRSLGIEIDIVRDTFVVHGGRYHPQKDVLSVGSSGTTMYFMVGLAALADRDVSITGQRYFQRRPIGPLLTALRQMGVQVTSPNDRPPIQVRARPPRGGEVHIAGTLSQWISGLLLLAPFARNHTTIVVDGELNEQSYVQLTVRMMREFGLAVTVSDDGRRYDVEPNQTARPADLTLPPDIGSAAFGLAVAAIHPADVLLTGLTQTSSAGSDHPEADLLDILGGMGLPMEYDAAAGGVRVRHDGIRLRPIEVDCRKVPDMLPILSTLASLADGESTLSHVEHVRLKESDRVVAMLQLNHMGARLEFDGHSLRVDGVPSLTAAHMSTFNDHRVLMSLAVAATAARGRSTLTYPHAYRISYPRFMDAMQTLGAHMEVEEGPATPATRPGIVHGPVKSAATAEGVTGPAWLRLWAGEKPHALAVVDARPDRTGHLTWGQLDAAVDQAGALFLDLGVQPGDRVAVQLPNGSDFIVIALAAMRIGAVVCPIMPIFRQREVAFALKRSRARVFVVVDNFRARAHANDVAEILDAAARDGDELALQHVLVLHDTPGTAHILPACTHPTIRWQAWHRALGAAVVDRDAIDARAPRPDDIAQLLFTSGTSGEPKGVTHTHHNLSRATQMEVEQLGLASSDVVYIPSPLAHQTGFLYGMWLALSLGVPQIVQAVWDAPRALEVLREWEGTFVQAATPFLTDLVRAVESGAPAPENLRIFVATGAAVPRTLAERATTVLGTHVCGAFGTTETGLATLASPADPIQKMWGTDGRAMPGVSLRIVDDAGVPVPSGTEGNFELTGPTIFDGYLDRPDLTREAFTDDGWYRTGDLAAIDEQGYLRITGRVRDVINRGGEKIPVSEIEQLLFAHEAIDDVAIVAMPDPRLGERACAFVTVAAGSQLTFRGVQRFLAERGVSKQYWPERLEIIETIPRNAVGKIQKFLLRQQASSLGPQRHAVHYHLEKGATDR